MSVRSTTAELEGFEATVRMFEKQSGRAAHNQNTPAGNAATLQEPRFDKATIASLSPDQIDNMQREDLVCVIRATQIPFMRFDVKDHLSEYDAPTLRRLAYLSRRICRNQGY